MVMWWFCPSSLDTPSSHTACFGASAPHCGTDFERQKWLTPKKLQQLAVIAMGKVVSVLPMLVNNLQAQGVFAMDIRNKEELEAKKTVGQELFDQRENRQIDK